MKRLHLLVGCLVLFMGHGLIAQKDYQTGVIHDSIVIKGVQNENFALYLPKSYSPEELNSIIFIFDPAARGAAAIQSFIPTAEKYGHILVCSNNSRNAPYERNFAIANNLFGHVFSSFNISEDEIYASGFSGGSRLATAIASLTNKFAGVVGCGAGFSGIPGQIPGAQDYVYVGLCGDRDMNYKEMLENKAFLNQIKFNSTLITFDAEHKWPPSEQIIRAFDWIYLQGLKDLKPVPMEEVTSLYLKDHSLLEQFQEAGQMLYEAEQYERMVKDYSPLLEIDSLVQSYATFLRSKELKKAVAAVESAVETERDWVGKLDTQLLQDFAQPKNVNWKWWEKELNKLDKLALDKEPEIGKMAYRIKFDLFVRVYSRKNELLHQQSTAQNQFINDFLELLKPKS
nr:hypothetical protein [Allomuricauda sp.]